MKYLLILPLLIGLGFSLADAQAQDNNTWYVGEGLKKGDYVSYELCHWDYNDCQDFQMDMWIDGEMSLGSESRWTAQVMVTDGNEQSRGNMELGKTSAEPFGRHGELKPYRDAFKSSVTWLASSASETYPGSLLPGVFVDDDRWNSMGIVPHTFSVSGSEIISLHTGVSFDTVVLKSDVEPQNRIWVADGFPFPIKAEVYLDRICNPGCPIEYKFELLDYSENMTYDSFLEMTSQPDAEYISPLKQFKSGVAFHETVCKSGLQLTQRHDGSPACVSSDTYFELIKRDWTSNIIKAIQSRDMSLHIEDALSSYMDTITPTLDDFKNILSEPYDIDDIFSKFGKPHDDIGSGIHIYVYDLNDLTEIWIGYVDDILYVKHVDVNGNTLEDLFAKNLENPKDCPISFNSRCTTGTITEIFDGGNVRVGNALFRLALVSPPELDEIGGQEAKEFLEEICPVGSDALVDQDDLRPLEHLTGTGRIMAVVYCNGLNLNEELVEHDFEYFDSTYCYTSEFADDPWAKEGCSE